MISCHGILLPFGFSDVNLCPLNYFACLNNWVFWWLIGNNNWLIVECWNILSAVWLLKNFEDENINVEN